MSMILTQQGINVHLTPLLQRLRTLQRRRASDNAGVPQKPSSADDLTAQAIATVDAPNAEDEVFESLQPSDDDTQSPRKKRKKERQVRFPTANTTSLPADEPLGDYKEKFDSHLEHIMNEILAFAASTEPRAENWRDLSWHIRMWSFIIVLLDDPSNAVDVMSEAVTPEAIWQLGRGERIRLPDLVDYLPRVKAGFADERDVLDDRFQPKAE
ncbi:hypothetical protein H2200_011503 [Cladophialophora chaetospira]|uniref:Uncharacterized protein n=1 Tax=Cladophialophora chaetospira TaxID=386627 RepID=A0AA39CD76_9EURO|nr:hypothetical protein H2200_011503 [Cladophialophora chaetospira]